MAQYCYSCGAALKSDARFCSECGAPVAHDATAPETAAAPAPPPAAPAVPPPAPGAAAAAPTPQPAIYAADPAEAAPAPARSNTPLLVGGGLCLVALAALATYFLTGGTSNTAALSTAPAQVSTPATPGAVAPGTVAPGTAPGTVPGTTAAAPAPGTVLAVPGAPAAALPGGATSGPAVGQNVVKYVISTANIRDVATAQAPSRVVGTLRPGTSVQGAMHRGLSGDSFWFKLADGRGYVSAVNLGDSMPAPRAAAAPPPPATTRRMSGMLCEVVDNTGSNLRIRAVPNGRVLGGLPNGVMLRVLGESFDAGGNLWLRVDPVPAGYATGWVFGDHVIC